MGTPIPQDSNISTYTENAYFADCFETTIAYNNQSALDVFISTVETTPHWINFLMKLRNKVVGCVGLKNLGTLSDIDKTKPLSDYQVGDRVGIFSLYANEHNEVILEDQDKHLGVKLSLFLEPQGGNTAKIYLNTVVHVNNMLGKVYMLFVGPAHKVIVPSVLKQLSSNAARHGS